VITEGHLARARLWPELLIDAQVLTIPPSAAASPSPLDLRRLDGSFVQLVNVAVDADPDVSLSLQLDQDERDEPNTAALSAHAGSIQATAFERISLDLLNAAYPTQKDNYRVRFGLWVFRATPADKALFKQVLGAGEQALLARPEYSRAVSEGAIPLPVAYRLLREYPILKSWAHARILNSLPASPQRSTLIRRTPPADEALVLRGIACDPGNAADGITIYVSRDEDRDYLSFAAYALPGLSQGVELFVPALRELRVEVTATSYLGAVNWHYSLHLQRIRLTPALKARWGIARPGEVPADLVERVQVGAL